MNAILAMLNIYIDPKASVDRFAGRKLAWIWPVLVMGVVTVVISLNTSPIAMRLLLQNPPEGTNVQQLQQRMGLIETINKVAAFGSPLIVAGMIALSALVLLGACAVMDVKAKFGELFCLLSHCSLVSFLQAVAGFAVIMLRRDDLQSLKELQPSFGLDLLLPEGTSKILQASLGYFSIFTVWYIIILGLAFAYLMKVPKSKAYSATAPVWILGMIFAVVFSFFRQT